MWSGGVFDDFRKEMDDLVGSFFGGERRWPGPGKAWANLPAGVVNPAIDVTENDDAITGSDSAKVALDQNRNLEVSDGDDLALQGRVVVAQKAHPVSDRRMRRQARNAHPTP